MSTTSARFTLRVFALISKRRFRRAPSTKSGGHLSGYSFIKTFSSTKVFCSSATTNNPLLFRYFFILLKSVYQTFLSTFNSGSTMLRSSSSSSTTIDRCKWNTIPSLGSKPWWLTSRRCARKVTEEKGHDEDSSKNHQGSRTACCDRPGLLRAVYENLFWKFSQSLLAGPSMRVQFSGKGHTALRCV